MKMPTNQAFIRVILANAIGILAILYCTLAVGQEVSKEEASTWEKTKVTFTKIADEGKWDLYLLGYARHFSHHGNYKPNEVASGAGFGKTYRNKKGNDESIFFIVNKDSNYKAEIMAGYAHQWIYPVGYANLELGVGVAAFIIRRDDWFGGKPFPGVLPVGSIGTKKTKIMFTYVPRLPDRESKSNVILVFARLEFG